VVLYSEFLVVLQWFYSSFIVVFIGVLWWFFSGFMVVLLAKFYKASDDPAARHTYSPQREYVVFITY